jgi:hypothetical protein
METMHHKTRQHVCELIMCCCPFEVGHGISEVKLVQMSFFFFSLFSVVLVIAGMCSEVLDEKVSLVSTLMLVLR